MKDFSLIPFTTGTFPDVTADQSSGPTVRDGAPLHHDWVNDLWGSVQAVLNAAGVAPSGSSESSSASDVLDSIRKVCGSPGEIIYWGGRDESYSAHENRLLALTGQVITITNYPELAAAVYCGDAYNGSDHTFYKTSDAGGTIRSTSGAYMVFPDCRGQFLRGLNGDRSTGDFDANRVNNGFQNKPGSEQGYQSGTHDHAVGWLDGSTLKKYANFTGYVLSAPYLGLTFEASFSDRNSDPLVDQDSPGHVKTLADGYDYTFANDKETRPVNLAFHVMIRY